MNMACQKQIIFLKCEGRLLQLLLSDLEDEPSVELFTVKKTLLGKFLLGDKSPVKKIIGNKLDKTSIINREFLFGAWKWEQKLNANSILVVQAQVLGLLGFDYFVRLKNKYHCPICLWIIDSVHASSDNFVPLVPDILKNKWDSVYTFDSFDAIEFGWKSINFAYYSTPKLLKEKKSSVERDVFYAGSLLKNREKDILNTYYFLKSKNVSVLFNLHSRDQGICSKYTDPLNGLVVRSDWQNYDSILQEVQRSKCIIEVLQENQKTQTIRYFEAVCFNKKLLTNNPNVVNLPYYNPLYMKYYSKPDEIDINWLKEDICVDYHYNNDFSPVRFIEQVKNDFGVK